MAHARDEITSMTCQFHPGGSSYQGYNKTHSPIYSKLRSFSCFIVLEFVLNIVAEFLRWFHC